mmetsp:Transcript_12362/g.24602  ORF Transcript_12362/g.24602 Transcript_12362/m.24602 type:complete len:222 (+) Transcript_12362:2750-3415(+)
MNLLPAFSGHFPHPTDSPSGAGEYTKPYISLLKKPQGLSSLLKPAPSLHCASNWHESPNIGADRPMTSTECTPLRSGCSLVHVRKMMSPPACSRYDSFRNTRPCVQLMFTVKIRCAKPKSSKSGSETDNPDTMLPNSSFVCLKWKGMSSITLTWVGPLATGASLTDATRMSTDLVTLLLTRPLPPEFPKSSDTSVSTSRLSASMSNVSGSRSSTGGRNSRL